MADSDAPRRVTLAAIAARAGTTVPTVSKVLNGRSDVSAAMRERILGIVAETGYARRRAPRRPAAGLGDLIDLVLPAVEGSWANLVLSGVESAAADAGADVVVVLARPDAERSWCERLLARGSHGAVLALLAPTPAELAALAVAGIPAVLLDPSAPPPPGIASVGASNWAGGYAAGTHLLGLGHRRFGIVGADAEHLYNQARIDGFRSALDAAGVVLSGDAVVRVGTHTGDEEVVGMLDRVAPTAVFACTDTRALTVYRAAAIRGLAIGTDLSVVGFDDLPEAAWASPGLTTVRQPVAEMGAAALRLLLRARAHSAVPPREELATDLVVRSSTGRPDHRDRIETESL